MGFFNKNISDSEWVESILPVYKSARAVIIPLKESIEQDNWDNQIAAIPDVITKCPVIRKAITTFPSPTSSEACKIKKELELALKDFIDGAKQGVKFFRDAYGGPGQRLQWGGINRRAAAGRLAFTESMYKSIVESGSKHLDRATQFFNRHSESNISE